MLQKIQELLKRLSLKVGQNANNNTEILSGLKTGEVVVSEGANTVSEGMKLTF